jgi:hypothetical protein
MTSTSRPATSTSPSTEADMGGVLERDASSGRFVKGMVPVHALSEHIAKVCPECHSTFMVHPCEQHIVCCSRSCAQKRSIRTHGHPMEGRHHSPEAKAKMRAAKLGNGGPGHWNWKHGKRRGRNIHWWRDAVFSRDDHTCLNCGRRGVELHAHHVVPFAESEELRHDVDNGVTLCVTCHRDLHGLTPRCHATTKGGGSNGR